MFGGEYFAQYFSGVASPSTQEPLTTWQPTSGNGEMALGGGSNLTTDNGLFLVTKSGLQLQTDLSTYSGQPLTTWTENNSI